MSNTEYYWYFGDRLIRVGKRMHGFLFKAGFTVGQITEVED